MMKRIMLTFLCIIPFTGYSQTDSLTEKSKFLIELNAGLNFSKFKSDTIDFNSRPRPFIGTSVVYHMTSKISARGTLNYSVKGSRASNSITTFENTYLDLSFSPRLELMPDFYFQTGVSYSHLLESNKIVYNGANRIGVERNMIEGYGSEINILTGIEFKIQDCVNMNLNYIIPTNKANTPNFQIGLNIALNKKIDKEPGYKRTKRDTSRKQIKELKANVLLVRLQTSENSINALIERGEIEKANRLRLKQESENLKIVRAFRHNFDFCDVQFFYSNNSDRIKQQQFKGIFLNDSLQVDHAIALDTTTTCLIAEFGHIKKDTTKLFSHYSYNPSEDRGMEKKAIYYSPSADLDFYALRMMDHNYVQLKKPFPYYTRAIHHSMRRHPEQALFIPPIYLASLSWSYNATVLRMNKKLKRYDKRTN